MDKRQLKQQKADKQTQEAVKKMVSEALLNLTVTDVRKISRSDALEIARSYGKDWQRERSFYQTDQRGFRSGYKGVQNAGAIDLLEIFYASIDGPYSGSLFVGYSYNRELAGFQDFNIGDVISIFGQEGRAISIFNHATNLLTSCFDINHITIHPNTGVDVQERSQNVVELAYRAVLFLKSQGQLIDLGTTPRLQSDQVFYRCIPEIKHRNDSWILWVILLMVVGLGFNYLVFTHVIRF